jgi:hypothetical protein
VLTFMEARPGSKTVSLTAPENHPAKTSAPITVENIAEARVNHLNLEIRIALRTESPMKAHPCGK